MPALGVHWGHRRGCHSHVARKERCHGSEVLEAAAAILTRDRAVLEAEARLGQALGALTSNEGMPVDEAAELCGLHVKEAKRLLRLRGGGQNQEELAEEVANS